MSFARRVTLCLVVIVTSGKVVSSETVTFGTGDQFEMEFVTIGNPGNAPDAEGDPVATLGAVPYIYHIAKYEVSQDMVDKANASTAMDGAPLELITMTTWAEQPTLDFYGIRDPQQPAIGVSWIVAARFVNWLNVSSGYSPAYRFDSQPGDPDYDEYWRLDAQMWSADDRGFDRSQPFRNRFARFVIPSLDEWYKAAYHDAESGTEAVYFNYPTGSDEAPIPVARGTEPGTAVYEQPQFQSQGPAIVTEAGGPGPYGTIGQGGNIYEHQESFPRSRGGSSWTRGGSWWTNSLSLSVDSRFGSSPSDQDARRGIRVAMLNPLGDFDENGVIAAADIDLLSQSLNGGSSGSVFDLDQNDVVDLADKRFWVEEIAGTYFGDADLNGSVEFEDFALLSASFNQSSGWAGGDFDGNGTTNFDDFVILANNFGREAVTAVPEPSSHLLWIPVTGGGLFALVRRR